MTYFSAKWLLDLVAITSMRSQSEKVPFLAVLITKDML